MSRKVLSIALMALVLLIVMVPLALAEETVPPVPIPEPGSLLMLGAGVASVAGYVGLRLRARK